MMDMVLVVLAKATTDTKHRTVSTDIAMNWNYKLQNALPMCDALQGACLSVQFRAYTTSAMILSLIHYWTAICTATEVICFTHVIIIMTHFICLRIFIHK